MKKLIAMIAGLALAGAALAEVNPTKPMLTGRGNVTVRPSQVIVTNQTADKPDEGINLDKFVVTGSLILVDPAHPMLTGHGNVGTRPGQVIVTNQTADKPGDAMNLEKFIVTGSLMKH